jgi:hypothetical protein
MTNEELPVEMFGSLDTVSKEFFDKADKTMVENVIKENLIRKVKQEDYRLVSEPVISEYQYVKQFGDFFTPVSDRAEADLILFRTTVKVVKERVK